MEKLLLKVLVDDQTKHVCGMFDGDQRTTKPLPDLNLNIDHESITSETTTSTNNIIINHNHLLFNHKSINLINNKNNNQCNCNLNYNHFNNNNKLSFKLSKSTLPVTRYLCDKKTLSIYSQRNYSKVLKSNRSTKLNSLLICIFFWIVFLQRLTLAKPIPRHIMDSNDLNDHVDGGGGGGSGGNGGNTKNGNSNAINRISSYSTKCIEFHGIIEKMKILTEDAYNEIYNKRLNDYTKAIANLDHLSYHEEWKNHYNENLFPEEGQLEFDYYHKPPPDHVFKHLYNEEISEKVKTVQELMTLYKRLTIIKFALKQIIDGKNADDQQEYQDYFIDFFKAQSNAVSEILQEIEMSLQQLSVKLPIVKYQESDHKIGNFDWITTREHLKILAYANKAYKILYELCK